MSMMAPNALLIILERRDSRAVSGRLLANDVL